MTGGMVTDAAIAVLCGSAVGVGLCLILMALPRWGAPSLTQRIAPYIRDIADPLGYPVAGGAAPPTPTVAWTWMRARLDLVLGGSDTVSRRLRQAGWAGDATAFRGRQLAWCLCGVMGGSAIVVAVALAGRMSPPAVVLPVVGGVLGAVLCDARLTFAARRRVARIEEELPTLLEFVAMCLSAGEGMLDSLRRVSEVGVGELSGELRAAVLDVGMGVGLGESLTSLSTRLGIPGLSRALDQVVAALDRGAPLAHVLQAQALDAREDARRALIERAGRKEIQMLVPLVFLILPLSVLFAIFPGVLMLRLGLG
jgi:tight adherence protein C